MFFRYCQAIFLISALICLYACASPQALSGGPEDEKPPAIIEKESTPNRQTNFKEDEIILIFDEWVVLKDIYSQLVVSPLMPSEPEIKQKGKAIIIEVPDSLNENTTYTINFGNAITDLNEGNILDNYAFVFSTGPVLDSIKMSGTVMDATNLKPMEGVWVMLHPARQDSAVYLKKPEYLTKTNTEGKWTLSNLRVDSFQLIALKDENVNFLYDQEGELLAWLNEPIYTGNLSGELPQIFVFPKEKKAIVNSVSHFVPGWLKLIIDAPPPKPIPIFIPAIDSTITVWDKDTLHVYYAPQKNYSGYAVLHNDSTQIRISNQPSLINLRLTLKAVTGRLHPNGEAINQSEVPLSSIDTSLISLQHDSLGNIPYTLIMDTIDERLFSIKARWIGQNRFNLTFLPGALHDFWGRTNDTIRNSIVITGADQYGELTMTIDGLDSTKQYLVILKEGEQIRDTFVVVDRNQTQLLRPQLLPAKYGIEIIEDLNRNGAWDTGDYQKKRQPERKMIFAPENLRAGWDLDVKMTWK